MGVSRHNCVRPAASMSRGSDCRSRGCSRTALLTGTEDARNSVCHATIVLLSSYYACCPRPRSDGNHCTAIWICPTPLSAIHLPGYASFASALPLARCKGGRKRTGVQRADEPHGRTYLHEMNLSILRGSRGVGSISTDGNISATFSPVRNIVRTELATRHVVWTNGEEACRRCVKVRWALG